MTSSFKIILSMMILGQTVSELLRTTGPSRPDTFRDSSEDIEYIGKLHGVYSLYISSKSLTAGDTVFHQTDKLKPGVEFFRIEKIIGAFVGFLEDDEREKEPYIMYVALSNPLVPNDSDFNRTHEAYMDWIGIPM